MDASPELHQDRTRWVAPVCATVSVVAVCVTVGYLARQSDSAKNIKAFAEVICSLSGPEV